MDSINKPIVKGIYVGKQNVTNEKRESKAEKIIAKRRTDKIKVEDSANFEDYLSSEEVEEKTPNEIMLRKNYLQLQNSYDDASLTLQNRIHNSKCSTTRTPQTLDRLTDECFDYMKRSVIAAIFAQKRYKIEQKMKEVTEIIGKLSGKIEQCESSRYYALYDRYEVQKLALETCEKVQKAECQVENNKVTEDQNAEACDSFFCKAKVNQVVILQERLEKVRAGVIKKRLELELVEEGNERLKEEILVLEDDIRQILKIGDKYSRDLTKIKEDVCFEKPSLPPTPSLPTTPTSSDLPFSPPCVASSSHTGSINRSSSSSLPNSPICEISSSCSPCRKSSVSSLLPASPKCEISSSCSPCRRSSTSSLLPASPKCEISSSCSPCRRSSVSSDLPASPKCEISSNCTPCRRSSSSSLLPASPKCEISSSCSPCRKSSVSSLLPASPKCEISSSCSPCRRSSISSDLPASPKCEISSNCSPCRESSTSSLLPASPLCEISSSCSPCRRSSTSSHLPVSPVCELSSVRTLSRSIDSSRSTLLPSSPNCQMSSGQTVSTTSVPTLPPSPFPSPPACEFSSVQSPRGSTPGALGGLSDPERLTTSTSANEDDDEEMHDDLYWTASKVNENKDNDDNASGGQAHQFSNCSHNDNGNVQISQKSENQQKSNGMCSTGCGCYTKNTCNTKYSHATPKESYDGNSREFIDEDNSNQDDIINQRYISDEDQLKMYSKPAGHTNEQDQTEKVEAVRIIRVEKHTQLRALSYRGVSVNNMHGDNGHSKHARQSKMQAKVMETHTKYVLCEIVRDMKTTRNPYDDCTKEGAGDFSIPNKSESDTLASQENLMQDVDYLGKQLNSIQNSFDKHDEKYEPLLGEGTDTPSQTKTNQSATIVNDTLQVGVSPKDIRCSSQAIDSLHRKIVHLEAVIATLSSENKSFIRDYVEYRNILSCYQNDLRKYVQAISERLINPRFQREPSKESSKAEWITYSRKVMQEVKAARGQKFALEATRKERDSLLLERNSLQKKLEIYAKLQEYFLAQHFGPPLKSRVRRLTKSAKKYKALVNQYKSSNHNLLKQRKEASSALRIYEEILQLREKELQMITALATEEIQNLKQEKESFLRQFEIEKTGGRKLCRERKNSTQSLEEFKLKQGDQRREDASESDAMSAGNIFPEKNGRETTYPKVGYSTLQQLPVEESSERLAADTHQLQDFLQNVQQKIHYLLHDTFQYSKEDVKNELMKISRYIDEIKQKMNRISKESCLIPNGKETAAREEDPKLHDICIKIILQGVGELYEDDFTYLQSRIQSARQTKNKDWDSESSNDDSSASSEYSTVNSSKYKLETDDENPEDLLHNLQYSDDERNIF